MNEDGSVTTANIRPVEHEGRVYNMPSYDYESGEDMTSDQMLQKFIGNMDEMESYSDYEAADKAAGMETFSIQQDDRSALKKIGHFVKGLNNHKLSEDVDVRLYPPRIRYSKEW